MPICPFRDRECFPECALYVPTVDKCSFVVTAVLLEDLQKIGVLHYEKNLKESPAEGSEDGT
jgi:hypothetical protein